MKVRLGRRVFDAGEFPIVAPAHPETGLETAADAAVVAVERAVAAGAEIVEVGWYGAAAQIAELVATIRSSFPDIAICVRAPDPQAAEAGADAGADLLAAPPGDASPWLAEAAAAGGTGLAAGSTALAEDALAAGVRRDGILVAASESLRSAAGWLPELVDAGWPVLITLPDEEPAAEALTAAAICAWLGARVFRTGRVAQTRQTLDMAATLLGTREPAVGRRGLA